MSTMKIILWMLGILLGIVLLCLGVIYLEKRIPVKQYDERQLSARARAHRLQIKNNYRIDLQKSVLQVVEFQK